MENQRRESHGDFNSTRLASAAVVPNFVAHDHSYVATSEQSKNYHASGHKARTSEEQKVEVVRLEDMWIAKLREYNFPEKSLDIIPRSLAASTRQTYNRTLNKLRNFCLNANESFPPNNQAILAEFLLEIAAGTERPKAQLTNVSAVMSCMSEILEIPNLMQSPTLQRLMQSLIKTQTVVPRIHTPVMPIEPFMDLFRSWPDNMILGLHELRIKTLALLALTVMLRPSDVAPRAETIDLDTGIASRFIMTPSQVKFEKDGSLTLWLHGIKNDMARDGFQINIPPASEDKIDPVTALKAYIQRTTSMRTKSNALFLTLRQPFKGISSATVAKDLDLAIRYAGLNGKGFSAKSFRPTGATTALQSGCQPDHVRAIGRWKCQEVFESHYVFPKAPTSFTDDLFSI
jgi:hypothetical protein